MITKQLRTDNLSGIKWGNVMNGVLMIDKSVDEFKFALMKDCRRL